MKNLSIDIETFSSYDLRKCGVYKYVEALDFEILLFAYSVDGGEVKVVDLKRGEKIPHNIKSALTNNKIIKWAHNANFERICLSRWLGLPTGEYLDPSSWKCTMVWSAYLGMPFSLLGVGAVLSLDKQKLEGGKDLIRYFCRPCKPTKANGGRTRNLPKHAPDKWLDFKDYNLRDVEVELSIHERLLNFPMPEMEWQNYILDQKINDRGILLDGALVKQAITLDNRSRDELLTEMKKLTNLENPNSVAQLKGWLGEQGYETESLDKAAVKELIEEVPESIIKVLELRQALSKSSVKKYTAMENVVCFDGRARGLIQFYGANRTGRFAGRLVQVQNLPRNSLPDLALARSLVKFGDYDTIDLLYDSVPMVLSDIIRTAFIPNEGKKFIVADFSSIERVVLAWLAGEKWVLEAYGRKEDLYTATASKMFNIPADQIDKRGPLRQKGKVADLACIAEGQLVLTEQGLVPIEKVTLEHKVWDGESFVNHDGVIYKGVKEVISYGGLRATPDHLVWPHGSLDPVPFLEAARKGETLLRTGNKRNTTITFSVSPVYDILNAGPNNRFTVSGYLVHNCGYGGSVGALKAMGALEQGLTEDELQPLVNSWRNSNPNIVRFWWAVDRAALTAVRNRTKTETHGIVFEFKSGMLFVTLPSGRNLSYVKPIIGLNKFDRDCVTYEGIGSANKWERMETYGPKLVENIVQAISRDLLCEAMQKLIKEGHKIVMHIHDEVVIEAPESASLDEVCKVMGEVPDWADGLILRADGFEAEFYQKD